MEIHELDSSGVGRRTEDALRDGEGGHRAHVDRQRVKPSWRLDSEGPRPSACDVIGMAGTGSQDSDGDDRSDTLKHNSEFVSPTNDRSSVNETRSPLDPYEKHALGE